jgi:hypothetical protein
MWCDSSERFFYPSLYYSCNALVCKHTKFRVQTLSTVKRPKCSSQCAQAVVRIKVQGSQLRAGRVMMRRVRAEPAALYLALAISVIILQLAHSNPVSNPVYWDLASRLQL